MTMLNGLDLFSGIGGISLALAPWVRSVAYCENDQYCQAVLLSRQASGDIPTAPIWDDICTLSGDWFTKLDIIYGGFPCQDISVAGNGKGLAGERSRLFWELHRLVKECQPAFVFLENVPAIRTKGLLRIIEAFTDIGYDCRWTVISAAEVGASHLRKRWFFLAANANSETVWLEQRWRNGPNRTAATFNTSTRDIRLAPWTSERGFEQGIFRVGNGIPNAVDRDRALGNAVVPAQAREAFKRLMGLT